MAPKSQPLDRAVSELESRDLRARNVHHYRRRCFGRRGGAAAGQDRRGADHQAGHGHVLR